VLRHLAVPITIVLLLAACSSREPVDLEMSYSQSWITETGEVVWVSSGPAVDEGAICAEMTMQNSDFEFESPDGSPLEERSDSVEHRPFVRTGEFTCVDGSGIVAIRSLSPNDGGYDTWELTGSEGYEDVSGQGQASEIYYDGDPVVFTHYGTGVITTP
jgi:hypothetical protein